MNNRYKVILFVIFLVVLGGIVLAVENKKSNKSEDNNLSAVSSATTTVATTTDSDASAPAITNETVSTNTAAMQSTNQLFSQSPDYSKAYLIYPTENAAAKKALTGFDITIKDLGNGTTQVSLPTKTQTDEVQSFIVSKGQKVYFVEKSMGDDSLGTDRNYSDDYGVAVDSSGYILK